MWPREESVEFGDDPCSFMVPGSISRIPYHQEIGCKVTFSSVSASYERILMKCYGGWGVAQGAVNYILVTIRFWIRIQGS